MDRLKGMAHPTKQDRAAELTIEDLHAAWLEAGASAIDPDRPPINMITSAQLGELWGKKESAARMRIRQLIKDGTVDKVMRYRIPCTGNTVRSVPHYHLKGT